VKPMAVSGNLNLTSARPVATVIASKLNAYARDSLGISNMIAIVTTSVTWWWGVSNMSPRITNATNKSSIKTSCVLPTVIAVGTFGTRAVV